MQSEFRIGESIFEKKLSERDEENSSLKKLNHNFLEQIKKLNDEKLHI
jgi:hypothetical protein